MEQHRKKGVKGVELFWLFLRKFKKNFIFLIVFLIIELLVSALSVLSIVPLADFMIEASLEDKSRITSFVVDALQVVNIEPSFWAFGMLFVVLNIFSSIIRVLSKFIIFKTKYSILKRILGSVLNSILNARWQFFSNSNQGVLLNTLGKELEVVGNGIGHLAMQVATAFQILVYVSIPLWIDYKATLTMLVIVVVLSLPFLMLNRYSYKLGKISTSTANQMSSIFSETVQSMKVILGFGKQESSVARYLFAFDQHADATVKSQTLGSTVSIIFVPLGMFAVIVSIGLSMDGSPFVLSELAAIMYSLLLSSPLIASFLQTHISIGNFLPSYEQIESIQKQSSSFSYRKGGRVFEGLSQEIRLSDVDFSYQQKPILKKINITIEKNSTIALIGKSGSGKTTIADLIIGLQEPDRGKILIDGEDLLGYNQLTYRQKIGYVPQEPILFHASIKENLLWSNDKASEKDMWESLDLANAKSFVESLPNGLETVVGDRGVRMSGGQRQRISLARALVRRPEILILDEATSSLDSESESLIQKSLHTLSNRITILVIAHRIATIKNADNIYVINEGFVVESGSFEELKSNTDSFVNKGHM